MRILQGDGVNGEIVERILARYKAGGWSADNIAFGCGGGLLQKLDRDTLRFAMKASAVEIQGQGWKDLFKEPITDLGKRSKKGRLALYKDAHAAFFTCREIPGVADELVTVFENGYLLRDWNFEEVRARSNQLESSPSSRL